MITFVAVHLFHYVRRIENVVLSVRFAKSLRPGHARKKLSTLIVISDAALADERERRGAHPEPGACGGTRRAATLREAREKFPHMQRVPRSSVGISFII
jgi:hypothetical protein